MRTKFWIDLESAQNFVRIHFTFMIQGHSRTKYVEFVTRYNFRSIVWCMVNAFEYFRDIPEDILTGNKKPAVKRQEIKIVI